MLRTRSGGTAQKQDSQVDVPCAAPGGLHDPATVDNEEALAFSGGMSCCEYTWYELEPY